MTASPLQLLHFEGGDALPSFRARALLERMRNSRRLLVGADMLFSFLLKSPLESACVTAV